MPAKRLGFDSDSIREGGELVRAGGLIAFPTDTVYGLGCDPASEDAVARLFAAKEREAKPIPILCASLEGAAEMADLDGVAVRIARRYWPGPLTLVAPLRRPLPRQVDQGTGMVGVRVPGLRGCLELVRAAGGYLTGTSANRSGRPSCTTADQVAAELGDSVDIVLDGGARSGRPSTVVRLTDGRIEVLREGPVRVSEEVIRE